MQYVFSNRLGGHTPKHSQRLQLVMRRFGQLRMNGLTTNSHLGHLLRAAPSVQGEKCIATRPTGFIDLPVEQFRKRTNRNADLVGNLFLGQPGRLDLNNDFFPVHIGTRCSDSRNTIIGLSEPQQCDHLKMTLAQRLKEVREEKGWTKADLRRASGIKSPSTLTELENGTSTESPQLPLIANALGVEVLWLQHGKGPKARPGGKLVSLSDHPYLQEVQRVRFKLSAGVSGYAVEPENGNGKPVFFRRDWFDQHNYRPDKLFAVRVAGASMEPSLWDGDLVVINTDDTTPHDGDVFAFNYEGEMVIKRMRRDAGEWFATSDNADQRRFAPKRCTEDVTIIGRVIYKQSERI